MQQCTGGDGERVENSNLSKGVLYIQFNKVLIRVTHWGKVAVLIKSMIVYQHKIVDRCIMQHPDRGRHRHKSLCSRQACDIADKYHHKPVY